MELAGLGDAPDCRSAKGRGASFSKHRGKWRSQIMVSNKNRHLGYYDTQEQALQAYELASQHGIFPERKSGLGVLDPNPAHQPAGNIMGEGRIKSQYPGVTWNKNKGKWQTRICRNGRRRNLGFYARDVDAHAAYMAAKQAMALEEQRQMPSQCSQPCKDPHHVEQEALPAYIELLGTNLQHEQYPAHELHQEHCWREAGARHLGGAQHLPHEAALSSGAHELQQPNAQSASGYAENQQALDATDPALYLQLLDQPCAGCGVAAASQPAMQLLLMNDAEAYSDMQFVQL